MNHGATPALLAVPRRTLLDKKVVHGDSRPASMLASVTASNTEAALSTFSTGFQGVVGMVFQNRQRHGRRCRAYMDVLTACFEKPYRLHLTTDHKPTSI